MGVRNVVPEVLFPRDHIRLRPPSLAQPESFSVAAIPPAAIAGTFRQSYTPYPCGRQDQTAAPL